MASSPFKQLYSSRQGVMPIILNDQAFADSLHRCIKLDVFACALQDALSSSTVGH